jgi:hypothetical protein
MVRWLVVIALAAASACTLFDEDPPGNACKTDMDCFRAQGEACNQKTHTCEVRMTDAGVDAP